MSASDEQALRELEPALKKVIFGQDRAIESLVSAIKLSRSGLAAPDKPIGSFLFSGPTGVGKTELAKQLAKVLGVEFLRFDMTEYMEKHTVSRLIGAPPGYVGFDQGGLLTDAIRKTPHAVLVLDEIEKAHPDIFNILLQVMDHATLTDNNGRKADFRNVVLIMTTNAGAREISSRKPGFGFATMGKPTAVENGKVRHRAHLHARVPQPARRLDRVRLAAARGHQEGRRQVRRRAAGAARREEGDARAVASRRATGWPSTASTRSSARGRWRGWFSRSSRSRSPRSCCSAS